jgi:hypothetical protein
MGRDSSKDEEKGPTIVARGPANLKSSGEVHSGGNRRKHQLLLICSAACRHNSQVPAETDFSAGLKGCCRGNSDAKNRPPCVTLPARRVIIE